MRLFVTRLDAPVCVFYMSVLLPQLFPTCLSRLLLVWGPMYERMKVRSGKMAQRFRGLICKALRSTLQKCII